MNAFEYIQSLDESIVEDLYKDPWACQAVFQSLTGVSKQFTLRLLCFEDVIPVETVKRWVKDAPQNKQIAQESILQMKSRRIVLQTSDQNLRMNATFQANLKAALSSQGGSPWERGREKLPSDTKSLVSAEKLEAFARNRWNAVLHYMVGSTAVPDPPISVTHILLQTGLMQQTQDKTAIHITDRGYEFMLKDVHVQMWAFMMEYITTLDKTGKLKSSDILKFLFQLSYCQTNQYYAVADLTSVEQMLLNDFVDFGLLYRRKSSSKRFFTTSLAVNLIFGGASGQARAVELSTSFTQVRAGKTSQIAPGSAPEVDQGSDLTLVIETNFKIYAYTNSSLHVAMLSVFLDIVTRLPNLVVGFITRESLRSALIHGISAQHIYDFMIKHVHPKMKNNSPIIPENIADQLFLWERERNRIKFIPSVLFDGFQSRADFESSVRYARDRLGCLEWADMTHFKLAITSNGESEMRQYLKKQSVR